MQDTSVKAHRVEYNRFRPDSAAPRNEVVRIYRGSPERVTLQLRNGKHYMTASLDSDQAEAIRAALLEGVAEIIVA